MNMNTALQTAAATALTRRLNATLRERKLEARVVQVDHDSILLGTPLFYTASDPAEFTVRVTSDDTLFVIETKVIGKAMALSL